MANLSPAAQAVLDAYGNEVGIPRPYEHERHGLAAALRVAAKGQMLGPEHQEGTLPNDWELGWNASLTRILAIADELESPL